MVARCGSPETLAHRSTGSIPTHGRPSTDADCAGDYNMNTAKLFWSKMKWVFMLILALVVVGSAIFLATHRTVPARTPVHTATTSQASSASQTSAGGTTCTLLPQEPPPQFGTVEFKTDFSKHCVHYSE